MFLSKRRGCNADLFVETVAQTLLEPVAKPLNSPAHFM